VFLGSKDGDGRRPPGRPEVLEVPLRPVHDVPTDDINLHLRAALAHGFSDVLRSAAEI